MPGCLTKPRLHPTMNLWAQPCAQQPRRCAGGEERKRRNGTYVLSPSTQRGVCHCAGLYGSVPGSGCRAGGNHRHPPDPDRFRGKGDAADRCRRHRPDRQRRLRRNVGGRASGGCAGAAGRTGGAGACEKRQHLCGCEKRHGKLYLQLRRTGRYSAHRYRERGGRRPARAGDGECARPARCRERHGGQCGHLLCL